MISLLRSEWYQIRKTLAVKIQFLVILAISVILGISETGADYLERVKSAGLDYLLYGGGSLLSSMEDAGLVIILAGLLACWIISSAFETRIIQEAICYGKSRTKVYLAKIMVYGIVSILICLVLWFAGSVPVWIKYGIGTQDVVGNLCNWKYVAGMVIAGSLAYLSIFVICGVVAFLTQKTSITMGICVIGIAFGFTIIVSVLPDSLVKLVTYTPIGLYHKVLKLDVSLGDIFKTSFISIIWIIVICMAGLWKFKKTELK